MQILFVVAEATPIYKIGGLGDVGGSLPKALYSLGVDIRLALPKHPEITITSPQWILQDKFTFPYKSSKLKVKVWLGTLPNSPVPVYLFEENKYLSQHTDASDNHADKFAVFSAAVSIWISKRSPNWQPHLIHLQDWHTALIPLILKHQQKAPYKTILTIHNLLYQGITDTKVTDSLNIKNCRLTKWDWEDYKLNIMLQGILHSSAVTTVSPNYASEVLTEEYGYGLNSFLKEKGQVSGILNGIDTDFFNPETDQFIEHKFNYKNVIEAKSANKELLLNRLGLRPHQHLIGFVGRVDAEQKGIDLIIKIIRKNAFAGDANFVFLGTGDPYLEKELHKVAEGRGNIKIITRFDEPLAHKIYAASDFVVIPSKFEPCGLVQMIAMRYGALPIARSTGGLKDTIHHGEDGFLFNEYTSTAFENSIIHAIKITANQDQFRKLVQNAIAKDFSWKQAAQNYLDLYTKIINT